MTDTLLRSLRDRMLDEAEPLAGLLRKCLLLGAETGSSDLREWARQELHGYRDGVEVPAHRHVPCPIIRMNSISGNSVVTGQTIDRYNLPLKARELVPEVLLLREPVEELETLSTSASLSFVHPSLAYAQAIWNDSLSDFQQVTGLYFETSGAVLKGVLGKIRTQLFEVVAELTMGTPLEELPRKEQVDAAVRLHIGAQYNTTVAANGSPTAIGNRATATVQGLSLEEALRLLDEVQARVQGAGVEPHTAELMAALEELRAEVRSAKPNKQEVIKKAGRLKAAAALLGVPALSSAVGGAVEAFTTLAIDGIFG